MLHYKQVFLNVFEKRESKCWGVLMKHLDKVNPFQDGGWEGGNKKTPPTSFSSVTSTNVGIGPQNFLNFSFQPICHTVAKLRVCT